MSLAIYRKKLDETTAELKRTSRDLALEKQRTDRLLYQMLPAKVADQLKLGKSVEAGGFKSTPFLFTLYVKVFFKRSFFLCSLLHSIEYLILVVLSGLRVKLTHFVCR